MLAALIAIGIFIEARDASIAENDPVWISVPDRSVSQLRVMTYNVEGLPWPARFGRDRAIDKIAERLRQMNRDGLGPDILVIQEGFIDEVRKIGEDGEYPYIIAGPRADLTAWTPQSPLTQKLAGHQQWLKGEGVGKFLDSGLWIFSKFPIVAMASAPYGAQSCAGFDCLANKGVVFARISVPGIEVPIDIYSTHLNSRTSSRVSQERANLAHHAQVDELSAFIANMSGGDRPLILAGDINVRHSSERFTYLARRLSGLNFVDVYCGVIQIACRTPASADAGKPWLVTQDHQLYRSARMVDLIPIDNRDVFSDQDGRPTLSDHKANLVTYSIRKASAVHNTLMN
ncbi:MAG: endonuclease/exonuclease/phosphatase family protein [Rhodobacteraceae bacterium]|nr:endonuclease/exonuclease/phosphatase family protein [Paracoccaceae bacterium]